MSTHHYAAVLPLIRRLLGRYLAIGLGCLFLCVVIVVNLSFQDKFWEYLTVAVCVPLVLLLLGTFVLRQTLRLNQAIEEQLWRVAFTESIQMAELTPLAIADPAAQGWNTLLEKLHENSVCTSLEERLQTALGGNGSKHWEDIFNNLPEGLIICDSKGSIIQANNAMLALLGRVNAESLCGEKITDILNDVTTVQNSSVIEKLCSGPRSMTCEFQLGPDLATGVWRIQRAPLNGNLDQSGNMIWLFRDVTQQKLSEEMRNQFVSTATHELRTPLANIRAYAETLATADEIEVEKQKGFYNIIISEATRLARFVDDLLNVSQMEAGAISISRHETDIERMICDVFDNAQPLAVKKNIQLEKQLPPKMPKLRTDKDKLSAALLNLLGNAIKYTPDNGQVRLLIELDGSWLHFHIEDTGIGISAEEMPHLFEKFFRSADDRVRKINGSGLGLAFSQEVARLHGGKIMAISELNKGSRFTLTLPAE